MTIDFKPTEEDKMIMKNLTKENNFFTRIQQLSIVASLVITVVNTRFNFSHGIDVHTVLGTIPSFAFAICIVAYIFGFVQKFINITAQDKLCEKYMFGDIINSEEKNGN